ncbi:MAG TPA: outer membrane lipoprotein chaperone LolA [Candidatus Eisenbacteria bacterium]|nr:outer membrane lipoprotein chaperone LolA [Candidatus Eisenbacteria bacterium]
MYRSVIPVRFLLAVVLTSLGAASLFAETDLHVIADKVDQRYNRMQTLRAQFSETYTGAGMTRTERGTLELKKPGRMRWDYDEPRPKMFLTDGKTAWFYVPGERQVRRARVKDIDDLRSPLRYLLGKAKLEKEFIGLAIAADAKPVNPGDIVLRGVPKGMQERVSQTLLEVSPDGFITRIVVEEMDGSVTEFRFLQQKEDVQIADRRFRFTPPPGVEVVQGTELVN